LPSCGAPDTLAGAVCYTQYPYRRGLAADLTGRSRFPLGLAPWELLFLEIVPRADLRETVVIGGRWYRAPDGALSVVPDRGAAAVRVVAAGKAERRVAVAPRTGAAPRGELVARTVRKLPPDDWLVAKSRTVALFPFRYPAELRPEMMQEWREAEWKTVKWTKVPSVGFELECSVEMPGEVTEGQILLLLEFPGREHRPSRCEASLDGAAVSLEQRSSDEHIGYYNWTGRLRAVESEWSWYLCRVGPGSHRVRFRGAVGHPQPRLGVWVWAEEELTPRAQPLAGMRGGDAAMPPYRDRWERRGVCLLRPTALGG
jgi:hypothetical protein